MPQNGGGPHTIELRALAEAYLLEDLPTFVTVLTKVRELAAQLGTVERLDAFITMVKTIHRGNNTVTPTLADLREYLADLKSAVKRVFAARSREPGVASISNIEEMIDSGSPRYVVAGLLLRHVRHRIWFDKFHVKVMTNWKCERDMAVVDPYVLEEREMLKIMMWAMSMDIETLATVSKTVVKEAVAWMAYSDERDALLDHIGGLPAWDGIERLDIMLVQGFGCSIDPDIGQTPEYLKAVSRNTMIGLIARAKEPGCQHDFMPIFCGRQGIGKSRAMRILGGPFYREIFQSPADKDFYVSLQGCWYGEVAELASIASTKVENAKTKAALSRLVDNYRPPYAENARDFPRRVGLGGTHNPGGIGALRDETGARRFGPVQCGVIDLVWLEENRDQLFAEALRYYEQGAHWWDMPQDAHHRATERHRQRSGHEDDIREHLQSAALYDGTAGGPALVPPDVNAVDHETRWGNIVTPKRVIMEWLHMPEDRVSSMLMEISNALVGLGWEQKSTSVRIDGRHRSLKPWLPVDQTLRHTARAAGLLTGIPANTRNDESEIPF